MCNLRQILGTSKLLVYFLNIGLLIFIKILMLYMAPWIFTALTFKFVELNMFTIIQLLTRKINLSRMSNL